MLLPRPICIGGHRCFSHGMGLPSFLEPLWQFTFNSDASGAYGCGAVCDSFGWFKLAWPVSWGPASITVKELVPVVLASAVWGPYWSGLHICFHSDNLAVVALLRSLTSRDHVIMHLFRCLSFFAALFRFDFTAAHVPGASNVAADALSCNNMSLFLSLFPQTPETVVPPVLTYTPDPIGDQLAGPDCSRGCLRLKPSTLHLILAPVWADALSSLRDRTVPRGCFPLCTVFVS